VAARNVLISSEGRGKIADFGLSRETDEDSAYYKSRGGQLPVRWTAPEALEDRKFGEKSDVWSFGILVHEIFTQSALPYLGMNNQRVWIDVLAGYRLPQPDNVPDVVYAMMLRCWKEDPKDRPKFVELSEFFGEQYTTTSGLPLPDGEVKAKTDDKKKDTLYSGIMKKFRSSLSLGSRKGSGSEMSMKSNKDITVVDMPGVSETAAAFRKNTKGYEAEDGSGGANYDIASAFTGAAEETAFGEDVPEFGEEMSGQEESEDEMETKDVGFGNYDNLGKDGAMTSLPMESLEVCLQPIPG